MWQTTDTHSNMDESQNHYTEWKKTDTKGYTYDFSDIKLFLKKQTHSTGIKRWVATWIYGRGCELTGKEQKGQDDKIRLYLDYGSD